MFMRTQIALTSKRFEHCGGGLSDWHDPFLGAFPTKQHLGDRIELKVGGVDTNGFADSGAGLSQEQQKCVVSPPDACTPIRGFKESMELGAAEMVEDWLNRALSWDGEDPLREAHRRRVFEGHVVKERADGGQTSVSRTDARSPHLLDMIEKFQDDRPVEIGDTQLTWSLAASS
jgi:hypothetical protein